MITLGIILLVIGLFTGISLLNSLGGLLLVIGVVLFILGRLGNGLGGRAHYY